MVHIQIKKGLDIPILGSPEGSPKPLILQGRQVHPSTVALDLSPFDRVRFKLLVKLGDKVKKGEPVASDKACSKRVFVAPAGGTLKEIRRGLKRRLLYLVFEVDAREEEILFEPLEVHSASREQLLERIGQAGLWPSIRQRPFDLLADPEKTPRAIYVKAVETAPFVPKAEMQVEGYQKEFQEGLATLKHLTDGAVHLVYQEGCQEKAFTQAQDVQRHTVKGPHPAANPSVHIHHIDPIKKNDEVVWTLDVLGVIQLGYLMLYGKLWVDRVLALAGTGIEEGKRVYIRGRSGFPVESLIHDRILNEELAFISGDPLHGTLVSQDEYLGFYATCFTVLPKTQQREFMHFFRLGLDKYSASRSYFSGHFKKRLYEFTTNMHGERRAFVISSPYDKVMPMEINTMLLVKAVMAEDFDLAETLGLLEVAREDFALPTFVCPSKIEMDEIMYQGLNNYAEEILG